LFIYFIYLLKYKCWSFQLLENLTHYGNQCISSWLCSCMASCIKCKITFNKSAVVCLFKLYAKSFKFEKFCLFTCTILSDAFGACCILCCAHCVCTTLQYGTIWQLFFYTCSCFFHFKFAGKLIKGCWKMCEVLKNLT